MDHLDEVKWKKRYSFWIAAATAICAILATVSSVMNNRCSGRAQSLINEYIFMQNEIANEWAFFQSKNIRISLTEIMQELKGLNNNKQEVLDKKLEELKTEKKSAAEKAKILETQRNEKRVKSQNFGAVSRHFSHAMSLLQIATILFPLSLITISTIYIVIGGCMGTTGIGMLIFAIHAYLSIT